MPDYQCGCLERLADRVIGRGAAEQNALEHRAARAGVLFQAVERELDQERHAPPRDGTGERAARWLLLVACAAALAWRIAWRG